MNETNDLHTFPTYATFLISFSVVSFFPLFIHTELCFLLFSFPFYHSTATCRNASFKYPPNACALVINIPTSACAVPTRQTR